MGNVLTMKTPELKKAPVVAAIYATYEKDPDAAERVLAQRQSRR